MAKSARLRVLLKVWVPPKCRHEVGCVSRDLSLMGPPNLEAMAFHPHRGKPGRDVEAFGDHFCRASRGRKAKVTLTVCSVRPTPWKSGSSEGRERSSLFSGANSSNHGIQALARTNEAHEFIGAQLGEVIITPSSRRHAICRSH